MSIVRSIVIGEHTPNIPGIEVIETRDVTSFGPRATDALKQLRKLLVDTKQAGIPCVLLQNIPSVLGPALWVLGYESHYMMPADGCALGIIVSVPGPREAGVAKAFHFGGDPSDQAEAERAVRHANGRAKVSSEPGTLTVTVDPQGKFVLSHIEWLSTGNRNAALALAAAGFMDEKDVPMS